MATYPSVPSNRPSRRLGEPLRDALQWLGRHELGALLSVFLAAFGALVFVKLATEMRDGELHGLDRSLLLAFRNPADLQDPLGPEWLEEMGRDFTALGGTAVLTVLTTAVLGFLVLLRKPRASAFVAGSVLGAVVLATVLKSLFHRPRPDLVPHLSYVSSSSFPSAHSMLSAAVYLTLGALIARLHTSLVIKAYVLVWAFLLTFLVGVSRVYVGVHWPTDVLAGWAAGAAWASICWIGATVLQRRGTVEPTDTAQHE